MKKVSVKMFFTVLWRGLCQALGWFFGLFGYKRDGKFAQCVWGLFATSVAIIVGFFAVLLICVVCSELYKRCFKRYNDCDDPYCYERIFINREIYFHNHHDGKGYLYNVYTGEKILKNITWIAKPMGKDSLICFFDGKKRGYFSGKNGRVVIKPKYNHAWIFSDGLASVEEDGYIKFIDVEGKVVIDKKMRYVAGMDGYVFHGGYCVVDTDDGEQCGLMDRNGNIVLPQEYSSIRPTNDYNHWILQKGEEMGVLDNELKIIIPMMECQIYINEGTIDITMPDHTMRKYDMHGMLIHDFYITDFRILEYEKDEIVYKYETHDGDGNEYGIPIIGSYHPNGIARLRAYVAGDYYEGLMTADGHVVTMPMYKNICAIGYDLYLCTTTNYDKVILNGKGEIVK